MTSRGVLALTVVAVTLVPAAAAQAAPAPAEAVVARAGGVSLGVSDDQDAQLCVALTSRTGSGSACSASEAGVATVDGGEPGSTSAGAHVGLAVPAAAASVEVRRAGRLLATAPTIAGEAYAGRHAGQVRFALLRLPAGAHQDGLRVRALDGGGALVSVVAVEGDSALVFDRRRLLAGHSAHTRWSITGEQSSDLRPSVLDLGHESVSRCLAVDVHAPHEGSGSQSCLGPAPRDALTTSTGAVSVQDVCGARFRLVYGVVDATVRRVTVVLGDGRRRVARSRAVGGTAQRVYAIVVASGDAVRRVVLDEGSRSRTLAVGASPQDVPCAAGRGSTAGGTFSNAGISPGAGEFGILAPVTAVGPVTTLPGTPTIRVADGPAGTLCVGLGDLPFTALGCDVVSPYFEELLTAVDDLDAPHAVVLAVPARVASIRISAADGGGARTIATIAPTGYAGPYAGHVRVAGVTVSSPAELSNLDLLDAAGNVLHHESDSPGAVSANPPAARPPRRLAGRAGRPSLWRTPLRFGGQNVDCLALTSGPRPAAAASCRTVAAQGTAVLLAAPCATRRLTVGVVVPASSHVVADLGGGRSRAIAIRHGAGLLTLAPHAGLRALTIRAKGHARRVALDAPAGARQCGWQAAPLPG